MSHSQFHSIEAFILRHAWLSLWDKHMTTGRINQVTIGTAVHLHRPLDCHWTGDSRRISRAWHRATQVATACKPSNTGHQLETEGGIQPTHCHQVQSIAVNDRQGHLHNPFTWTWNDANPQTPAPRWPAADNQLPTGPTTSAQPSQLCTNTAEPL